MSEYVVTNSVSSSKVTRYLVMLQKELHELVRSFKIIWVPLVFILLGIMQPVTSYYMPIILEKAGGLPEGTTIDIPLPAASQVLAETLSQFGTLGVLVLVLVFMSIASGERNSGVASLILVKPISVTSYMLSKWSAMLILSWGSLLAGYSAAWYYTDLLIGRVAFGPFIGSYLVYALWLLFIMSVTLLFSTLLRSAAGAAFSTLGLAVLLSLLSGLFPKYAGWTPGSISGFAYETVMGGVSNSARFGWSVSATLVLIAAAVSVAIIALRRSPAID